MLVRPIDEVRYLKTLRQAINHHSFGSYRIVSGAWRGSQFLGWGRNLYKVRRGGETLHPLYTGAGVHAELDSLTSHDCRRATLYIAGVSKTGYEIVTKPCRRCEVLIKNSHLLWVVYFDGEKLVKVKPQDL